MLQEQIFYRRYANRFPQQLLSPRIVSIDFLEFPKNSAFHYTEVDNVSIGPLSDEFYFRNINRKIPVRHITQLASNIGNPRRLSIPIDPIIRKFHATHRRYRWLRHGDNYPADENQLVVINHALCSHNYKYIRSPFSDYNRWLNINATIFHQLGRVANESGRHQYAIFHLPKQLPSVPRLNTFTTKQSQQMLRTFSDPGAAFILEVWKWLDPQTRHLSTLNYMDPSQYNKINLIFEESGQWMMFNLGVLDSWIFVKDRPVPAATPAMEGVAEQVIENTLDWLNVSMEDVEANQRVKITPDQIRRRFLRCLMTLMETRTVETSADALLDANGEPVPLPKSVDDQNEQSTEETESLVEKRLASLDDDLKQLEIIEKELEIEETIAEVKASEIQSVIVSDEPIQVSDFDVQRDPHDIVADMCDKLAADGLLSGAEYKRMMALNEKSTNLESPVPGVKLRDFIKISEEDLKVKEAVFPDKLTIIDKTQLKSSLNDFDKNYITKTLQKETIAMALATQKAGFVVTDYKVEVQETILGAQEVHSFRINPVVGKPSTIYFKLPKVDPSGEFLVGGNRYRMRKQRTDLPIRKISHNRVQLSSYYGKIFVTRSDRKVDDYGEWLVRSLNEKSVEEGSGITSIKPGNVFDNLSKTPLTYSSISRSIREVTAQGFTMHFDIKECSKIFGKELVDKYSRMGFIIFGDNGKGAYLLLDDNNTLYKTDSKTDPEVISTFEEFFNLDSFKAPVSYAECRIFGEGIPVGLILGYYYGLEKLLSMLKVVPRRVLVGQRTNLQAHEWKIDFADETLIFNKDDKLATLILAGFNAFEKALKNYSVYKFDSKGVYLNVLEQKKITTRYIREIDLLDDMFVDPITESLLKFMKEPTTFRGLIVRSSELLMNDYYPNPLDLDYQTVRGYERFAGAIYSEMVIAVREQRRSLGRAAMQISLNPLAVWKRVTADPAVKLTEDINPVNNLKEMEAVTFTGVGGRSSRTMNAASRVYDNRDKGMFSEATSDSGDVGINTYLVANPNYNSVRGTSSKTEDEDLTATNMLSTSANLAVGADTDDIKRVGFISIQNQHTVACDGYMTMPVRTGYEQVVSHRVGEGFCTVAEQDGIVESINEAGGIIVYKDGTRKGFILGRRFGHAAGQTIPHEMATWLKPGDKVKAGDIVAYNKGWFEQDYFNPGQVLYKAGILANVALIETPQTHEDACTLTENVARKLKTKLTKIKKVRLNFNDVINNLVPIGGKVSFETPLVLIQDEVTASIGAFSDDTIATLASISQQSPTAKTVGVVENIEVFYHGQKEDMSASVRALCNYGDKLLAYKAKSTGSKVFTGSVDESYRVDGDPLLPDTLCIVFYITEDVSAGIADKVVFANQMKSIISEIADYEIVTESGATVDALFGAYSIFKRIVNSAFTIGTTTVLMELGAKEALRLYKGK